MPYVIYLIFFLSALPLLTVSLQCYTCDNPFTLNYTVTSDTISEFTNCRLINDTLRDYIIAMALLSHTPDGKNTTASDNLNFGCVSW